MHLRLIKKNAQIAPVDGQDHSIQAYKHYMRALIRSFPLLRDRFRYAGMFESIYLDNPPDSSLTQWTVDQLLSVGFEPISSNPGAAAEPFSEELKVIVNTVVWFLEKLAMRGELTWSCDLRAARAGCAPSARRKI